MVPRGSVPLVGELEARIDEAVVIARASEEGVREVGKMALDAARQARRAAEAAEKSAEAAAEASRAVPGEGAEAAAAPPVEPRPGSSAIPPVEPRPGPSPTPPVEPRFEVRFRSFSERAERVSDRLRRLCEQPGHPGASTVGAGRRRGDG